MAQSLRTRYAPPAPVIRPHRGTTYAAEAPENASTFQGQAGLRPGALTSPIQVVGDPASAATALRQVASAPGTLGTAPGSSRIIPNPTTTGPALATPGGGSFQGFSYTDPKTGRPAFGSASTPTAGQAARQDSGIFVNGQSVTHDANSNLVAAPVGQNPAQKFALDQAVILAEHPEIGVAGSEANKKFLSAYKDSGNDQENILATARQTFGIPTQPTAADVNPKDADAALIPSAIARGNAAAANPPTSEAAKAGVAARNQVSNTFNNADASIQSATQKATDTVGGFLGFSPDQTGAAGVVLNAAVNPLSSVSSAAPYAGTAARALGSALPFASLLTDPSQNVRPVGQTPPPAYTPSVPVAPPTNSLAGGAGAPVAPAGSAGGIAPPAYAAPTTPAISDDGLPHGEPTFGNALSYYAQHPINATKLALGMDVQPSETLAPVAPPTNSLAKASPIGGPATAAPLASGALSTIDSALGIPSAADLRAASGGSVAPAFPDTALAPGALTTPVDPEELKRRQAAAQANNS